MRPSGRLGARCLCCCATASCSPSACRTRPSALSRSAACSALTSAWWASSFPHGCGLLGDWAPAVPAVAPLHR
eukprot:10200965-Alexandrium_andersonii.AAC.1